MPYRTPALRVLLVVVLLTGLPLGLPTPVDGEHANATVDSRSGRVLERTDSPALASPYDWGERATGVRSWKPAEPSIASVYPNPLADGDRGEYVHVSNPTGASLANWTITDGETTVTLGSPDRHDSNDTAQSRVTNHTVVLSADPDAATRTFRNASAGTDADSVSHSTTTRPFVVAAPGLDLSNAGERIVLRDPNGRVVDSVTYDDAPEGERYANGSFSRPGTTSHRPWVTRTVDVHAFVLPDTPVPLRAIRRADDRVLVAGYTFASPRTARALEHAAARGVDVRILVDDAPVGGVSRREVRLLDDFAAGTVTVRALGGDRARYDYHHAKYAVADDTAIVLTENWKPSGTGGRANRGWGVVIQDAAVASDLATVFDADWHAPDARPWSSVSSDIEVEPATAANGTYPSTHASRNVSAERVTVVTAPDNAERVLRGLLRNATDRVRVLQMDADRDGVLVAEAIAAARRDVDVDVLLSSAWYAREDNARVVDALNRLAERDDLPLEARLVDPRGRFQKVHAKGVVVDDTVVVGSINWNDHSLRENREVAVLLHGDAVAAYYASAFDADWSTEGPGRSIPRWLLALGVLAALVLLGAFATRIDYQ